MITKFFRLLFKPSVWTLIDTQELCGSYRSYHTDQRITITGRTYTLQNQFGDIKFKTVWSNGKTGEWY